MTKNEIVSKINLSKDIARFEIYAPLIARKAKAGQFVILKAGPDGERVPVTLVDWDEKRGTITVIIQTIGKSTAMFNDMKTGDIFDAVAGPLGTPVEIKRYGTVAVVGGGVGIAEVYPIAASLKEAGNKIISVLGARTKDLLILENEMQKISNITVCTTDDGSYGQKGLVTDAIQKLHDNGEKIDAGFVIGPVLMMKFTCRLMENFGIKSYASLNPIILDGTGMCGCCRVIVGGKLKYACVNGPEFDGHLIDWNAALNRSRNFKEQEAAHLCKLKVES